MCVHVCCEGSTKKEVKGQAAIGASSSISFVPFFLHIETHVVDD